jgi:hypothetical protein
LREIHTLVLSRHPHIVNLVEILVNPDSKPAYLVDFSYILDFILPWSLLSTI